MIFFVRRLKYANFHRDYYLCNEFTWPPVFLSTCLFFYHLNLIPCHYWSWQRNVFFLVNIFVRHTFSMSKSSTKTKTVLTMADMTESTELLAFKRQLWSYCKKILVNFVTPGPNPPADMDFPSQIWTLLPNFPFKHRLYHIWKLTLFASFLSMFFSITTQHSSIKEKKNIHFVLILPHLL